MANRGGRDVNGIEPELVARIDAWRERQPDSPSRGDAVHRLIERGMIDLEAERLFQIARLTLLTSVKSSGHRKVFRDAYAYAWAHGVYPWFDEIARFHEPFVGQFRVSKEMVEELATFLDKRWLKRDVPTFYQIEDHFRGTQHWGRGELIITCRYMYLCQERFDAELWKSVLKQGECPTEAATICAPFVVDDDIYFA